LVKQHAGPGRECGIDGTALSSDAVANLISKPAEDRLFQEHRDQGKLPGRRHQDMQAFRFTLTCEKAKS